MADSYLETDAASLSPSDAERALVELLNAYGTKMTPEVRAGTHRIILTLGSGGTSTLAAPELLTQLHLSGACELDRARWVDTDPYGSIATEVPEGLEPEFIFAPRDAADVLNLCRHGVGGLLREISLLLHRHPAPAILRVARAPLARFVAHV